MTAQEQHIEIDLLLQKLNSQSTKNIIPQEKDWFLNREVINYIQQKVNPSSNIKQLGFEDTAKRLEDIKDLVRVVNRPIEINSRGKQFVTFPSNYFAYIRFDAYSYKNCPPTVTSPTPIPTVTAEYKATFTISLPSTLTVYTITLVKSSGTTTLFELGDLPAGYLGNAEFDKQEFLMHKALKILLPPKLKTQLSPNTFLYWEKEGYDYNNVTFTVVSDTAFISIDIQVNVEALEVNTSSNANNNVYAIVDTPLKAKARVVDDEFLTEIENSHLSGSRAYSPVSIIRENVLELSPLSSVIFGSVDIVYICTPNIIDLLLGSNLNVSEKVAKEITGNTVLTLKGIVESKDYQTYAQKHILTE